MTAQAGRQTGMALALTLWMLTLLTVMAAAYAYSLRVERQLINHGVESARARAIAEAGIWLAVADLLKPKERRRWRADGTPARLAFGAGEIDLRIQDEAGKIDLNTADAELLRGLLATGALAPDERAFLLHAILDWRDEDSTARLPGAEDDFYAGRGHGAKDGPFNTLSELRLVAGMTDRTYRDLHPALTIHSLQPGVNPLLAPRSALLALPGADAALVDEFLARRHLDDQAGLPGIDGRYVTGAGDVTFSIASVGEVGRSRLKLEAVVTLGRGIGLPYTVLAWRESVPDYRAEEPDPDEAPAASGYAGYAVPGG